jgi:hypothetical protein
MDEDTTPKEFLNLGKKSLRERKIKVWNKMLVICHVEGRWNT